MRRLVSDLCFLGAALLALVLLAQSSPAQFNSFPPGVFTGRAALDATPVGGAYTGPGNTLTFRAWFGFRCYSSTFTGNVADIWDSSTGSTTETLLTCSSGGTINQTVNSLSTTCSVSCSLKTWYDQSGQNACSGSVACDMVQATNATRPIMGTGVLGSAACTNQGAAQGVKAANALTSTINQTYSYSAVYKSNGANAQHHTILGNSISTALIGSGGTNLAEIVAGSVATATASDSTMHAVLYVVNGSSSSITVDGSTTGSLAAGAVAFSGTLATGNQGFAQYVGNICEVGLVAADITSNLTALNSNMHSNTIYGTW